VSYCHGPIDDDGLIAVLDADKLAHGMDPLVTTIADSDNTHYLAVSPVPPPSKVSAWPHPQSPRREQSLIKELLRMSDR